MDKEQNMILGALTTMGIGATVYPDAADILKIVLPLIAGALAPTIKDFLGDISDYFREKILKLKPRKKEIESTTQTEKKFK